MSEDQHIWPRVSQETIEQSNKKSLERTQRRAKTAAGPAEPQQPGAPVIEPGELDAALADNEAGEARLVAKLGRGRFVFDGSAGIWYFWQNTRWEQCHRKRVRMLVDALVALVRERIAGLDAERRALESTDQAAAKALEIRVKGLRRRVDALNTRRRRDAVIDLAASGDAGLVIDGQEWDARGDLLPCANRVLELGDAVRVRDGSPEDYSRSYAPVSYNADAKCPLWERTILEILDGNATEAAFLRRYLGSVLLGEASEHFLVMYGPYGRNGKNTIINTLDTILGSFVVKLNVETLLDQGKMRSSSGATPDLGSLVNKRLAYASEPDKGKGLAIGLPPLPGSQARLIL